MKLCTNWRWKSRKPTSSGAEVMSVAAQMIDQSMPWSPDENTCRPTVSGPRLDRVGDDERPQEVVPVIAHRDEAVGDVDRAGERNVDLEQHLERARAFDARGVVELLRHGLEGLAQQEDAEGRGDVGQRDRRDRVDEAEPRHGAVVLDDQHVRHDHQLRQHEREGDVAAAERVAREGVGGERAQHELAGEDHA